MGSHTLPDVRNDPSKIQLERISHVYFQHEDLDSFAEFAKDFGFVEAWRDQARVLYRGYGKDQYCYVASRAPVGGGNAFAGPAFVAQSSAEFEKAASLPGAQIQSLSPFPGGGRQVTLKTPSGFDFHVVFGQDERPVESVVPTETVESQGPLNGSLIKPRLGQFRRFHSGPAIVHKLGHLGYIVGKWDEEVSWYTSHFNFVPSDVLWHPEDEQMDVMAFMHLDLGDRFSDHHSLFCARATPDDHDHMHHTSYEVEDFDTQMLGHEWLASKNYQSVWGVGRHILGSQIFDYWRDPSGFTIEHYADGDLVNQHTGTRRSVAGPLAVWGPEIPKDFTEDGTKK